MTQTSIRTWADGFGVWHAALHTRGHVISRDAREQTRQAIIAELAEREGPNFAPESVQIELYGAGNGWAYYVEVDR